MLARLDYECSHEHEFQYFSRDFFPNDFYTFLYVLYIYNRDFFFNDFYTLFENTLFDIVKSLLLMAGWIVCRDRSTFEFYFTEGCSRNFETIL